MKNSLDSNTEDSFGSVVIKFLFYSSETPRIDWGLPLIALMISFFSLFSSEVTQSVWGILGIIALVIYGVVFLSLRLRDASRW